MKVDPLRVVVIEDDEAIRRGLTDALTFAGYLVTACPNGEEGLRAAQARDVDLALIDVLLPGIDGFEVLDRLRAQRPGLPVIMLTARGAESDRVRGLRGGADDYVVKPYSARELLARVEAVMRRARRRGEDASCVEVAGRRIDIDRREVVLSSGERRQLSEKEVAILAFLAECRGRAVGREELLRWVWKLDPRGVSTRTVDMHVARLRDKLEDGGGGEVIVTVRGKGYMIAEPS